MELFPSESVPPYVYHFWQRFKDLLTSELNRYRNIELDTHICASHLPRLLNRRAMCRLYPNHHCGQSQLYNRNVLWALKVQGECAFVVELCGNSLTNTRFSC